jgi:polyhydroxyalkanoate synthesis repressor PhaR
MAYVIKRHPNRKLYDAQERRYVTLGKLHGLGRSGTEISVVDVDTRKDLTSIVLAQIILEGERSHRGTLPPGFLHQLVISPSNKGARALSHARLGLAVPSNSQGRWLQQPRLAELKRAS